MPRFRTAILTLTIFIFTALAFSFSAQAQLLKPDKVDQYNQNVDAIALDSGFSTSDSLESILGQVIRILLTILGTIFLILLFFAGQNWMRAGGNEEKVTKARKQIWSLVIGLLVVLGAFAISSWIAGVFAKLVN